MAGSGDTSGGGIGNSEGIINMEDDDDDESDHEIASSTSTAAGAASANNTFSALFSSFTSSTPATAATAVSEGSKPFEILRDLLCHHAHLAVFMNYVISNSDSSALVSGCCTKKFAELKVTAGVCLIHEYSPVTHSMWKSF